MTITPTTTEKLRAMGYEVTSQAGGYNKFTKYIEDIGIEIMAVDGTPEGEESTGPIDDNAAVIQFHIKNCDGENLVAVIAVSREEFLSDTFILSTF